MMPKRVVSMVILASLAACSAAPAPDGDQIFRRAIDGRAGGALLSYWGDAANGGGYLAGGYVGVDPARITDGHVGRLVGYTTGAFRTLCTTDQVLWWTVGTADASGARVVYASGEGGRVLRYRAGGTGCETLAVDAVYPQGAPTFWGIYAAAVDDVWLVGGSALPDGPRGVVVHYDGTHFVQQTALPAAAMGENLYKIDRASDGSMYVVGSSGIVLRRDPASGAWATVDTGLVSMDNRLFTVSCDHASSATGLCYAVGGSGSGVVLRGDATGWSALATIGATALDGLPGLNGVFVQDASHVFAVGVDGYTMFTDGASLEYEPPTNATSATLHGVFGAGGVTLAVGGQLGVTDATQTATVLVRGDASTSFVFDGQAFVPSGRERRSLGAD